MEPRSSNHEHDNAPVHMQSSMKTWLAKVVVKTLTATLMNTFGMNWNADCVPGLLERHQRLTSLMLLWQNGNKSTQPCSKISSSQKSGGCYGCKCCPWLHGVHILFAYLNIHKYTLTLASLHLTALMMVLCEDDCGWWTKSCHTSWGIFVWSEWMAGMKSRVSRHERTFLCLRPCLLDFSHVKRRPNDCLWCGPCRQSWRLLPSTNCANTTTKEQASTSSWTCLHTSTVCWVLVCLIQCGLLLSVQIISSIKPSSVTSVDVEQKKKDSVFFSL